MVATELITGMEDIVQHIKDLEEENKKLKEEVEGFPEKLKLARANAALEFNLKFNEVVDDLDNRCDKKLKEENKKLKQENKKLKEEQLTEENAIRYVYENTDEYDDWVKDSTIYQELKEENKKLQFDYDTRGDIVEGLKETIEILQEENEDNLASLNFYTEQCAELKEERKGLKEEIKKLEDRAVADYDTRMNERKKLKQEIFELEMKGNARKDIIKNMFECITADLEEVQDGFTINRDWGNKYIDKWNEIVTQEYKDALKEINEQLEGIEWETDGFRFYLNIVEEEDSDDPDEE